MVLHNLLLDKRELFREGLRRILTSQRDIEHVCTCRSLDDCVDKCKNFKPDITIIDTEVESDTRDAIRYFLKNFPESEVLILTHSEYSNDLFVSLKSGAKGYLTKDASINELMAAINIIGKGDVIISPVMASKLVEELISPEKSMGDVRTKLTFSLSKRESEILDLLSNGATNKDIAASLFITENTVKVHLRNIMEKLHVKTRLQAVLQKKDSS